MYYEVHVLSLLDLSQIQKDRFNIMGGREKMVINTTNQGFHRSYSIQGTDYSNLRISRTKIENIKNDKSGETLIV